MPEVLSLNTLSLVIVIVGGLLTALTQAPGAMRTLSAMWLWMKQHFFLVHEWTAIRQLKPPEE